MTVLINNENSEVESVSFELKFMIELYHPSYQDLSHTCVDVRVPRHVIVTDVALML